MIRLVAIADTHGLHRKLRIPGGDVLVHAGDLTRHGHLRELDDFDRFLGELPHAHKIVIAGNHDFCFERDPDAARARIQNAVYLQDEGITILGLRFWGSPWQPWFLDWAFNLRRGPEIRAKWDLIPQGTDVLVTHGPPAGRLDRTVRGEEAGCEDLLETIGRIRPRVHVFGHIHEGAGMQADGEITFVNASSCNVAYEPVHEPIVVDIHR